MRKPLLSMADFATPSFRQDPNAALTHSCEQAQSHVRGSLNKHLIAALDPMESNQSLHFVSRGSWSNHNIIEFFVSKWGPAALYMTTWSMTEDPLRALVSLKDKGLLTEAHCIIADRVSERKPGVHAFAQQFFDQITMLRLHAKVTALVGSDYGVAVVSSANFTRNPRIEAGVIDTSLNSAQFHKDWILSEIANATH